MPASHTGSHPSRAPGERRQGRQEGSDVAQEEEERQLQQRQSTAPVVWGALGRVAGSAWTALQLCHRYVLVPATVWVLRNLKAYIEEQIAIQRAMALGSCAVPKYGEDEIRQATDNMGFAHRALGTPYGMLVYLAQLRGKDVAVRPVHLSRMEDVDAFWSEAEAGRALLTPGPPHPHIVPYLGCCPALTCHVYEQRPYTCSLRQALAPSGPYAGAALGCWEARLALCQQVAEAAAHLVRSGVTSRDLSASHILVQLDDDRDGAAAAGADSGACRSSSTPSTSTIRGPQCWLAPGCGFQGPPSRQHQQRQQQEGEARASAVSRVVVCVADLGRSVGQVLMQILGGVDSPVPPPSAVVQSLVDLQPGRLLSPGVVPPLTDDQAWPLLAAVYPLLVWGDDSAGRVGGSSASPSPGGIGGGGGTAAAASGSASGRTGVGPGPTWPWAAVAAEAVATAWDAAAAAGPSGRGPSAAAARAAGGDRSGVASGGGVRRSGGGGVTEEEAGEQAAVGLQGHLLREVVPVLAELRRQLERQGAAAGGRQQQSGSQQTPTVSPGRVARGASAAAGATQASASCSAAAATVGGEEEEDAFAGASAPPLPEYTPIPDTGTGPHHFWQQQQQQCHYASNTPVAAAAVASAPSGFASPAASTTPPPRPPGSSSQSPWQHHSPQPTPTPAAPPPPAPPAAPPEDYLCPITHEVMDDPVVAADGHSYERAAIARWFGARPGRPTSPLTGAVLPSTTLTPNYALRRIIGDWRAKHGGR